MVPKVTAVFLAATVGTLPLRAADPIPAKPLEVRLDTGALNVPAGSVSLADPAFGGTLNAARLPAIPWSQLTNTPNTVTGYGLTIGVGDLPTIPAAKTSGFAASATTDTTNAGNISSGTLPVARLPILNQNTTGTAANVTGVVALANGGTGAGTPAQALAKLGGAPAPVITSLAYAATITPTAGSAPAVVNLGTLTGNLAVAAPTAAPYDGQTLTFRFVQDAAGGRVITWNAAYVFPLASPATSLPTGAGNRFEITFGYCAADATWRARGVAGPY